MSKRNRGAAALAAAAVAVILAACSNGSSGGNIASVNGEPITRSAFDQKLEDSPTATQVLTQMVQGMLIDQYGKNQKIGVTAAEVAAKENAIKSKYPPGQFDAILKQQGLTEADVQKLLREQLIVEKAVAPQVHVTAADIQAYFQKNHTLLDKPAQVEARHILVADEKTAEMIEAKLKAGGNFAALAKQYSIDPSTKDKGGELGFFGKGQMVPAFQNAAFALPVGATSAPVHSPFGWHIIQVEAKKPAQIATLAASSAQIKQTLTQQQEAQQVPLFLQQLREKANITVNDDRYADAFPPPLPAPAPASAAPVASAAPGAPSPAPLPASSKAP